MKILFCYFIFTWGITNCNLVYKSLNVMDFSFCTRKLDSNSQFGCTSTGHSYGVLTHVLDKSKLKSVLDERPFQNTILLIPLSLFKLESEMKNIRVVPAKSFIKGLIVYYSDNEDLIENSKCPNEKFNFIKDTCKTYPTKEFNNYTHLNWPFPIVITTHQSDSFNDLKKYIDKFNNQKYLPKFGVEIKTFMSATQNAENCIRKNNLMLNVFDPICKPFPFINAMFYIGNPKLEDKDKVSLVLFNINIKSLFSGGLLASQVLLKDLSYLFAYMVKLKEALKAVKKFEKNLIFAFLDGESYDYIGSFLIINELKSDKGFQLFDSMYLKKENIENIFAYEPHSLLTEDFKIITPTSPAPPSSIQPFSKYLPKAKLTILKTRESLDKVRTYIKTDVTVVVADVESYGKKLEDCFTKRTTSCDLFDKYLDHKTKESIKTFPPNKFPTTVAREFYNITVSTVLRDIGFSVMGIVSESIKSKSECEDMDLKGKAKNTLWKFHDGKDQCVLSPFIYQTIYNAYVLDDFYEHKFPIWMRSSIYEGSSIRAFIIPSRKMEMFSLFLGFGLTLFTFVLVQMIYYFGLLQNHFATNSDNGDTEIS